MERDCHRETEYVWDRDVPHVGPKDYTVCYLRQQLKHPCVNRWMSTARQIRITLKQKPTHFESLEPLYI